jgi:hypothetical protein
LERCVVFEQGHAINNRFIETEPSGHFDEINDSAADRMEVFLNLVKARHSIKYSLHRVPVIPKEILVELRRQGYVELILKSDEWTRFLVPR